MPTPKVPDPDPEDFDEILEWTEEEEEAFLDILNKKDKDKLKDE